MPGRSASRQVCRGGGTVVHTGGLPTSGDSLAAHEAGRRAARNTFARAAAELVGKLASLVLFAVLARKVGQHGLGAFVFAFAFLQLALVPIDLGYDRWLIRRLSAERGAAGTLTVEVFALKLVTAIPVGVIALVALHLLGYGLQARETVYALAAGMLLDSFGRTVFATFTAFERSDLLAVALIAQRLATAGLGLAALFAGYGVVAVAGAYSVGAGVGLLVALVLLVRLVPLGGARPQPRGWSGLLRESAPFGVQDVFSAALFRVDALILSLIATQNAVGRYGAAYRAFEATFFVSASLTSAFVAMYTYLGRDTSPSVQAVFQRSIKACVATLMPVTVLFAVVAGPVSRALFGADVHAAPALRLLAPCVVTFGVVTLSVALYVSRRPPRPMVWVTAAMAVLNVVLNLALIPSLSDRGAAIAMSATEVVYALIALAVAVRLVGGVAWASMLGGPLVASVAMAAAAFAVRHQLVPALAVSLPVYALVLLGVERITSPGDLAFVNRLVRRGLRASAVDLAEDAVERTGQRA
jgi:O-antigen/teichoic acid export membrane protein